MSHTTAAAPNLTLHNLKRVQAGLAGRVLGRDLAFAGTTEGTDPDNNNARGEGQVTQNGHDVTINNGIGGGDWEDAKMWEQEDDDGNEQMINGDDDDQDEEAPTAATGGIDKEERKRKKKERRLAEKKAKGSNKNN